MRIIASGCLVESISPRANYAVVVGPSAQATFRQAGLSFSTPIHFSAVSLINLVSSINLVKVSNWLLLAITAALSTYLDLSIGSP